MIKNRAQTTVSLVLDFFNSEILAGAQAYTTIERLRLDARWSVRGDWTPKRLSSDGVIYDVVDNDLLESRIAACETP